jgi:hypothetical protein
VGCSEFVAVSESDDCNSYTACISTNASSSSAAVCQPERVPADFPQAAFLSVLSHESEAVSARPHMLETAAPALQGPLNKGSESLKQRAVRSIACTLALSSGGGLAGLSLNPGPGGQGSGFSVVATGFSNGSVYAHALELGQVLPVWLDAAPQCAYNKNGEVAAVRYEVEAVPAAPAAAGEGNCNAGSMSMFCVSAVCTVEGQLCSSSSSNEERHRCAAVADEQ